MARKFVGVARVSAAVGLALVAAAPAHGAVDVTALLAKPIPTGASCSVQQAQSALQAGQAADFCLAASFSHGPGGWLFGDDVRDMTISLPPGQIGSPNATPRCSVAVFESPAGCPDLHQVGTIAAAVDTLFALDEGILNGQVYNLTAKGTEPALLGLQLNLGRPPFQIKGAIKLQSEARLRAADAGLDSVTLDSPRDFVGLPLAIKRIALTLWGPDTPTRSLQVPFMQTNPQCDEDSVSKIVIRSWGGDTTSRTAAYRSTDCETLKFTPEIVTSSTVRTPDSPMDLTFTVKLPDSTNAEPRAQGLVKNSTITLPEGIELSPSIANANGPLAACTAEQFGYRKEGPSTCPEFSQIGEVKMRSALLTIPELKGKVFLRAHEPGGPKLGYYVVAEAGPEYDALRTKLRVTTLVDPKTGRVSNVLEDLLKTSFSEFEYTYYGGPGASLVSPRTCGTYTSEAEFEAYHGPVVTSTASMTFDENCESVDRFEPTFSGSVSSSAASADTLLTTTLGRPDGTERLAATEIELPAGLSGRLTAADSCPLAKAAAGDCAESSRVGTVEATAGPGSKPAKLNGNVYLTEGSEGALAGLAIVVNATVGPIDLGRVVTQAAIRVREDIGLTLSIPSIPLRQDGIAVSIREMVVKIDKAGFNVNSSSCEPKTFRAKLTSDTGKVVTVTSPYQATGCSSLPYAPTVAAELGGGPRETVTNGHPSLKVTVAQKVGEARHIRTDVSLPNTISIDSNRLDNLCSLAVYDAGNCPATSVVGTATALSPLLPTPMTGPVTFVSVPGETLPGLRIDLRGALTVKLKGKVAFGAGNRITTILEPLPDTPLTSFTLNMNSSPTSLLAANTDLCQAPSNRFDASMVSHAGLKTTASTEAVIPGCGPAGTVRLGSLRTGKPSMELLVSGVRAPVTTSTLRLPTGLSFANAQAIRKALRVTSRGLTAGSRARVTVSGRTLRVTAPAGQSATLVRVRLRSGAIRSTARLRRAGRPRLSFGFSATTKDNKTTRATLRVRPTQ